MVVYRHGCIQGWMHENELNFLYNAAQGLPDNSIIIELGSWKGKSSHAIASGMHNSILYCIDTFKGAETNLSQMEKAKKEDIQKELAKNLKGFNYIIICGDSALSAKKFEDASVDMIFLDANHDYEYVKKDIKEWWPKLKKKGIFCGHDYKDDYKGVKQAVDEKFKNIKLMPDSIWMVTK